MVKKILSINELKELLNKEEYRFIKAERKYIKEFEANNIWTDDDVMELFDTIIGETGLPPTPDEYLNRAFKLTKDFWFLESDKGRISKNVLRDGVYQIQYLHWSSQMEKAIKWRLSRMYQSLMAEYSALCAVHSLYPEAVIMTSKVIDLCLGVDLVVMDGDKTVYIHVTKNSKWVEQNIADKAEKSVWLRNIGNKKKYWHRQYSDSHVVFVYDSEDSDTTNEVNGHFIFRENYVQSEMEKMWKLDVKENEIKEFDIWLKSNWIDDRGVDGMIVTYHFDKGDKK